MWLYIKYLLFPFSVLYGLVLRLRHFLYDVRIIKSKKYAFPVIGVGNLSIGGSGKTPMIDWLLSRLKKEGIAVVGRGYKRQNKATFLFLDLERHTAQAAGDELFLLKYKYPHIRVIAAAQRRRALNIIAQEYRTAAGMSVVLLDDAFQHRRVTASYNIVLSAFHRLYAEDYLLPVGYLRDIRAAMKRAQMVLITKCPEDLTFLQAEGIKKRLHLKRDQVLFFASLRYAAPYHWHLKTPMSATAPYCILWEGIADVVPLKAYIRAQGWTLEAHYSFRDHHHYTLKELQMLRRRYERLAEKKPVFIITTEKDAVKWTPFKELLSDLPLWVLPVRHHILFNQSAAILEILEQHLEQYLKYEKKETHSDKKGAKTC